MSKRREPSLLEALTPIIFLIVLLACNVNLFDDTLAGSNQIALMTAAALAAAPTILILGALSAWRAPPKAKICKKIGNGSQSPL